MIISNLSWLEIAFYILVIITTVYTFIKFVWDVSTTIRKNTNGFKLFFKALFTHRVSFPTWILCFIVIILISYLITPLIESYLPEKKMLEINEEIYYYLDQTDLNVQTADYGGVIEVPQTKGSNKLICRFPPELSITSFTLEAIKTTIDNQDVYIWENPKDKMITIKGDLKISPPFSVISSFDFSNYSEGQKNEFNLDFYRNKKMTEGNTEFIQLYFFSEQGAYIEPLGSTWKKIVFPDYQHFYHQIDLDKEELTSFNFEVIPNGGVDTSLEIVYYKSIMDCEMDGYITHSLSRTRFITTLASLEYQNPLNSA